MPAAYGRKFPGQGLNWSYSCWPTPQATTMQDLSCLCDLHHSSQQCWIPDPLRKARDQTCILTFFCATMGTPKSCRFNGLAGGHRQVRQALYGREGNRGKAERTLNHLVSQLHNHCRSNNFFTIYTKITVSLCIYLFVSNTPSM